MNEKTVEALSKLAPNIVFLPGDEVYEQASQFFKRTLAPSAVVRPASSKDMATTIRFINEHTLPFAIKSGGHSNIVYNLADGIILIDLSALSSVKVVDTEKGYVQVGAGALGGEVADKLDDYGLAVASGDSRVVGMGGLATGGGLGFLVRKYGALVDNIIAVEVVTADGAIVTTNKDTHADLFWAIRGGGSNFGVATHFIIQAHPVKDIFELTVSYPLDNVATILKGWRDVMRVAPAELTTILTILPEKADAPGSIAIHGCVIGADEANAKDVVAHLLTLGKQVQSSIQPMRYKDILEAISFRATARRGIARNAFLKTLTDECIDTVAGLSDRGVLPTLQIRHTAGAMNTRPADMTAFSHRDSEALAYYSTGVAFDATGQEINASLKSWQAIEPFGVGSYINMSSEATEAEIAKAFPPEVLNRLRKIKKQYDPDNIFNTNYNIRPGG